MLLIELILNDDSFEGHVEVGIKSNTFKLESIPASYIQNYEPDETIDRGFYLLTTKPNRISQKFQVYVGESKDLVTRIKRHLLDEKKVFEQAIIIYDVAGEMSGDHAKYIEETLIQFLNEHPNVSCGNGNKGQAPKLKTKHAKYCKEVLEKTALVLQSLGYSFMADWGKDSQEIKAKYTLLEAPQEVAEVSKSVLEIPSTTTIETPKEGFDFSQFPIFEYRFPSDDYPHRNGWVARMKVTGIDSFTLLKGSYVEGNDELRAYDNYGDYRLSFFKKLKPKAKRTRYFNVDEHAKLVPQSKHYITKLDLPYTAPSSPLDILNGHSNRGWLIWKTAEGETLDAVNERLGNPLGRKKA
jgi:hypothetical protein